MADQAIQAAKAASAPDGTGIPPSAISHLHLICPTPASSTDAIPRCSPARSVARTSSQCLEAPLQLGQEMG